VPPPNSVPPNSDADSSDPLPNSSSGPPELPPSRSNKSETPESETPESETPNLENANRPRPFPWFWLGTFLGTLFSAAGLGLAAWAWIFINEDLSPLISKTLSDSLERPVALGDVERVTFGSLQVGPSDIGASEKDPTTLSAESVTVKFDLIETLLTSELGLDLVVEDADGVLSQDEEKGWLNFELPEQDEDEDKEQRFEVRLDDIRVRDSRLTLIPLPPEGRVAESILLNDVNGFVSIDDVEVADTEARQTRFEVKGAPEAGGEIAVKGEVRPVEGSAYDAEASEESAQKAIQQATNLAVRSDKAPLKDILSFTLSTINLASDQVEVEAGTVSGTLDMAFRPEQPLDYSGVLTVDETAIAASFLPLTFENVEGQTRFDGNEWAIDRLSGRYGEIEAVAEGLIDFDEGYALTATASDVSVEAFTETADFELPVPTEGVFDVVAEMGGAIDSPEFKGSAIVTAPLTVDKLTFTSAATDFLLLQGNQLYLNDIAATPNTGGALRGSGQVGLTSGTPFTFQLAARSLPADALAKVYGADPGFKLGLVSADARVVSRGGDVRTTVDWQAPNALYPGSGTVAIRGDRYDFTNTAFAIGGGTASGSGSLVGSRWQGDVDLQSVQLNAFSEDLKGDVSGAFNVSGSTSDSRIGAIAASGNVRFSDGLSAFSPQFDSLADPLTAQVAWNGDKLQISEANTERITASGTLTPIFDTGFEGLERLDLEVVAQGYELNDIPFVIIPEPLDLTGVANFSGTISGDPMAPTIVGDVQVVDLVANRLPFETRLGGTLNFGFDQGLDLNLAGGRDTVALTLGPSTFRAESPVPDVGFDIRWRDAVATGETDGNILTATADNFPLSTLNFPPGGAGDIGQLRGTLTDTAIAINLQNQTVDGDLTINQLGLGYLGAGQLAGKIRYVNNLATLTGGTLVLNENLYTLSGALVLGGSTPIYSASLATEQGNIQNLLTALSIYRLEDIRRGLSPPDWLANPPSQGVLDSVLATSPARPQDPKQRATFDLVQQLRRLSEIQAIQSEQAIAEAADPLPPLRELKGPFAGALQLEGSGNDFQLDFDLAGADWSWGEDYSAEEVIAKGSLTPDILTFEPVRFASVIPVPVGSSSAGGAIGERSASESGVDIEVTSEGSSSGASATTVSELPALSAGNDFDVESALAAVTLSGQLVYGRDTEFTSNLQATAQNLNVEAFRDIFQIPIDIDGYANASATLGGTLANPQMRGSAGLDAVTINDTPIESAAAQFLYQNARLSLTSALTATAPEHPLRLSAQIPYAFNFMDMQPDTDDISVNISVEDEGLTLLNIFTDQVAWQSGAGQFNLDVGGTLNNPQIEGAAVVSDATIGSPILPEPLTNVTGNATFEGEEIVVQSLQGQFSDGQLTAAGTFPLLFPLVSGRSLSRLTAPVEAVDVSEPSAPSEPSVPSKPSAPNEPSVPAEAEVAPDAVTEVDSSLFALPLAPDRPLTASFEDITLNFNNLYEGGVNGQIVVGGSALLGGPQISGRIVLSEGAIILPDSNVSGQGSTALPTSTPLPTTLGAGSLSTVFRDLRLTLEPSTRIVQGNLLNFTADGTLLLNGPPSDLEPEGTISIRSGRVSLFDTIFRLRGSENMAVFTPESGLQNPLLDLSLRASVPEVRSSGLDTVTSTPFARAEIAEIDNNAFSNPGSLRTVRVRADIEGPTSDIFLVRTSADGSTRAIFENLELSSSPPRSDDELIVLLGGGFADAVRSTVGSISGQNADGFSGLINLVGGSLLTRVQDVVVNTLNVSEFSIFPVTPASRTQSDEDNENETGIDIASTIGVDVTQNASVSLTKILTDDTDPEIGLNYRLTDALTVRGATNFDDVNQFLLEYEIRF